MEAVDFSIAFFIFNLKNRNFKVNFLFFWIQQQFYRKLIFANKKERLKTVLFVF